MKGGLFKLLMEEEEESSSKANLVKPFHNLPLLVTFGADIAVLHLKRLTH